MLPLALTGRAFEHGPRAHGARYVKPGLTTSPQLDLALALGWPHARTLAPPSGLEGEALRGRLLQPFDGTGVPADLAARRVRGMAAFMCGPDGEWRPAVFEAVADETPFTEASAADLVRAHLARPHLGMGVQAEVVFGLESLVGPDAVLLATADALEAMSPEALRAHSPAHAQWVLLTGFLLLRASAATAAAVRLRLEGVLARGMDTELGLRCVASSLDHMLHGPEAASASGRAFFFELVLWSDATPAQVLAGLAQTPVDRWALSAEPRLVLLGGDEVLDYYRRHWGLISEAPRQRELVERFGAFTSARLRPLMEDLAERSKARKQALAWLAAHPVAAVAVAAAPPPPRPPLPALDPRPLLAALDAAAAGNGWPDVFALNPEDQFRGLRVLGLRDGPDWAVVFERLEGDGPDTLALRRWCVGGKPGLVDHVPISIAFDPALEEHSRDLNIDGVVVTGPHGTLTVQKAALDKDTLALCKRDPTPRFTALLLAYLAVKPGALWPDAAAAAAFAGLGDGARVVVACDAFAHVPLYPEDRVPRVPSASPVMQSLADAVAHDDGARFAPGTPDTRWRDQARPAPKRKRR
jgi:hypothetical protein